LQWGVRPHETEPIGNAVDMGIDTNTRLAECVGQHKVGRLATYSRNSAQLLEGFWDATIELCFEHDRESLEVASFRAIETHRMDQSGQFSNGEFFQVRRFLDQSKKPLAYCCGGLIPGSGAEDGAHENPEGCRG